MRARLLVGVTAVFATSFGAVGLACSSSSEAVAPPPEAGGVETGPLADAAAPETEPYPFDQVCTSVDDADVCRKCAIERCCNTRDGIFASDAGSDLVSCNAASGCGESCNAACFARYPAQVQPYLDHFACMAHRCLTECASPVSACSACLDANCTLDNLACNSSKECFLSTGCGAACPRGDEACLKGCAARYPGAAQLQTNLAVCGMNRCPTECSNGVP